MSSLPVSLGCLEDALLASPSLLSLRAVETRGGYFGLSESVSSSVKCLAEDPTAVWVKVHNPQLICFSGASHPEPPSSYL